MGWSIRHEESRRGGASPSLSCTRPGTKGSGKPGGNAPGTSAHLHINLYTNPEERGTHFSPTSATRSSSHQLDPPQTRDGHNPQVCRGRRGIRVLKIHQVCRGRRGIRGPETRKNLACPPRRSGRASWSFRIRPGRPTGAGPVGEPGIGGRGRVPPGGLLWDRKAPGLEASRGARTRKGRAGRP